MLATQIRLGGQKLLFPVQESKILPKPSCYTNRINQLLKPTVNINFPVVLDLFAGVGGLSLGFESQGFNTIGFEMDRDCCDTYNTNLVGECHQIFLTPNTELPNAEIIIGGPPCQPFSVRGKQKGLEDERNGFPTFIAAIKKVRPELWIFENVRGLLYRNKDYFNEVVIALQELGYSIDFKLINASEYDTPQNRERVVVVGTKKNHKFKFPEPMMKKVNVEEALGEMMYEVSTQGRYLTPSMDLYIAKYETASKCVAPRDLHPNRPARTLTCRNLSGATSDMHRIKLPNGKRRRITPREAARLQGFPDWFDFQGAESSVFNQIGNAVAPMVAYHIAGAVKETFKL